MAIQQEDKFGNIFTVDDSGNKSLVKAGMVNTLPKSLTEVKPSNIEDTTNLDLANEKAKQEQIQESAVNQVDDIIPAKASIDAQLKAFNDALPQADETAITERTGLKQTLAQELEQLTGKNQALQAQLNNPDLVRQEKELANLNAEIAGLSSEFDQLIGAQEGRGRTKIFTKGRQAQIARQKAVVLSGKATQALALQGNIEAARNRAKETVDLEYAGLEQSIANTRELLALNTPDYTAAQQREANNILSVLEKREKLIEEEKTNKKNIYDLAITARQNGADQRTFDNIVNSEDYQDALLNASEYIKTPNTSVIDIGGRKKLIDSQTGEIIRDLGQSSSDTPKPQKIGIDAFGNDIYGVYNNNTGVFDSVPVPNVTTLTDTEKGVAIQNALSRIEFGSVAEQKRVSANINRLLQTGDIDEAKDLVKQWAFNSVNATQQDVITGKNDALTALDRIEDGLSLVKSLGYDTGFIQGKKEKVLENLGSTTDPAIARVANQIGLAIIDYRKAVSGAAFTESEAKAYDALFPSVGKTGELNETVISSLREKFNGDIDNFYKNRIGSNNWDKLFNSTKTMSSSIDEAISNGYKAGEVIDFIISNNPNIKTQVNDARSNNYTDDEIIEYLKQQKTSFNQVGGDTNTASNVQIPQSARLAFVNNNPGNLRFVGQRGATQGEGGFARFSSPQAGYEALKAQIALDTSRGHTLASFINKYAPPSENATNQYIDQVSSRLGVSSSTLLSNINLDSLAREVARKESSTVIS